MKLFFRNGIIFILFLFLFTEIAARIFHISTDAPKTYKNKRGNIRYYPNQEGYWNGGQHKWYINALGFPGKEYPKNSEKLISVIGDSFIQNFMNPDSCRQAKYLSKLNHNYNYIELSRDGADLLEYFEFVKELDTLKPVLNLMYVNTNDFLESIKKNKHPSNFLQLDIDSKKLYFPPYQGSKIKDILYHFKFVYYLYRKNLHLFQVNGSEKQLDKEVKKKKNETSESELLKITKLLNYINHNYNTDNVIFIFHSGVKQNLVELTKKAGFKSMRLKIPYGEDWTVERDSHWSCYGHSEVAKQVVSFISKYI